MPNINNWEDIFKRTRKLPDHLLVNKEKFVENLKYFKNTNFAIVPHRQSRPAFESLQTEFERIREQYKWIDLHQTFASNVRVKGLPKWLIAGTYFDKYRCKYDQDTRRRFSIDEKIEISWTLVGKRGIPVEFYFNYETEGESSIYPVESDDFDVMASAYVFPLVEGMVDVDDVVDICFINKQRYAGDEALAQKPISIQVLFNALGCKKLTYQIFRDYFDICVNILNADHKYKFYCGHYSKFWQYYP